MMVCASIFWTCRFGNLNCDLSFVSARISCMSDQAGIIWTFLFGLFLGWQGCRGYDAAKRIYKARYFRMHT